MKILDYLTKYIAWLQIAASPALIGLFAALGLWFGFDNSVAKLLSVIISLIGLGIGIGWAEKQRRGNGTIDFISRVEASPDANPEQANQHTTNA